MIYLFFKASEPPLELGIKLRVVCKLCCHPTAHERLEFVAKTFEPPLELREYTQLQKIFCDTSNSVHRSAASQLRGLALRVSRIHLK